MKDYYDRLNAKRLEILKNEISEIDEDVNQNLSEDPKSDLEFLGALKWAVRLVEKHLEIGARNAERFKQTKEQSRFEGSTYRPSVDRCNREIRETSRVSNG